MDNKVSTLSFISLCSVIPYLSAKAAVTPTEFKDSTEFPILLPDLKPIKPNKPSHAGNEIVNNPPCIPEPDLGQSENTFIRIALYSKENYKGEGAILEIQSNKCKGLPKIFTDGIIKSIDTLGSCLFLYERKNCEQVGNDKVIIYRHEIFATNLSTISPYFNPLSLEICDDGNILHEINLYEYAFFGGKQITFYLHGNGQCYNFESDLNDLASSLTTNRPEACIILWSEKKCRGVPRRLYGNSYGVEDFGLINFDNEASSVQMCVGVDK